MPYHRDNEYYVAIKNTRNDEGELINPNGTIISINQDILDSLNDDCVFKKFAYDYIINDQDEITGPIRQKYEVRGNWVGCALTEDWKHELVDYLVEMMNVEEIEGYIANIGMTKCAQLVDNGGMYESENMLQELTTIEGLRKFFYCVMYEIIEIAKGVIAIEHDEFVYVYGFRRDAMEDYLDRMLAHIPNDDEEEVEEVEIEYGGIVASAA